MEKGKRGQRVNNKKVDGQGAALKKQKKAREVKREIKKPFLMVKHV